MSWQKITQDWDADDNQGKFTAFGFGPGNRLFVVGQQSDDLYEVVNYSDPSTVSMALLFNGTYFSDYEDFGRDMAGHVFTGALITRAQYDYVTNTAYTQLVVLDVHHDAIVNNAASEYISFQCSAADPAHHFEYSYKSGESMPRIDWPCFGPFSLSGIRNLAVARGCLFVAQGGGLATPKSYMWSGSTAQSAALVLTGGANDWAILASDTSDVVWMTRIPTAANHRKVYKFNWASGAFDLVGTGVTMGIIAHGAYGDAAVRCYGGHVYAVVQNYTETAPSGLWLCKLHLDQTAGNCVSMWELLERVEQSPGVAHSLPTVGMDISQDGVVMVCTTGAANVDGMNSIWRWNTQAESAATEVPGPPAISLQRLGLWSHRYAGAWA